MQVAPRSTSLVPPPLLSAPPIIGNAIEFMRSPYAMLERGYREKGRVFGFRLGKKKAVVLLGPENNRFFFEQTDKLLSISQAYPFLVKMFDERLYFLGPQDEYKAQRTVVLPCFQGKKMVNYVGVMARETRKFLDGLGEQGQFDLTPALGPVVMNVASAAFLGDDFRQRLGEEFFGVFRDFSGGLEAVLPLWLPIPRLRRSQRAKRDLHRMIAERIADRRAHPRESEDFLQTLVEAKYPDGRPIPDILIINLIMMLVWAGHETTSGHVSWGIVDLLQNPTYLEGVLVEQREVLGGSEELNLEKVNRMKRLEWALKESERLHPVAPFLLRVAADDFEVSGFRVEKGTLIFVSPAMSHRIPDVFPSPESFDPERFAPPRLEDKVPHSLIGFGGGTHRCAGVHFAYQEMKVIVALLLQRYELELLDRNPKPITGASSAWPASPCRVRYRARKALAKDTTPARAAGGALADGVPS